MLARIDTEGCRKKVTPKEATKNVRVTQIHGSMEGKDILSVAKKIREEKEMKENTKKEAIKKKGN